MMKKNVLVFYGLNLLITVFFCTVIRGNIGKHWRKWNDVRATRCIRCSIISICDYLTFFIMMIFFKADEKLFQTAWMLESVISAMVVMLIVRTARPVFKSKASKKLIVSIIAVYMLNCNNLQPYQQLLRPNCITYQGTNRYAFYIPNLWFSRRNNEEKIL